MNRCSSHRLLALRRGEAEGFEGVYLAGCRRCIERLNRRFVKGRSDTLPAQVEEAVGDSFKRLLKPSIETEFANPSKMKADEEAIRVFSEKPSPAVTVASPWSEKVLGVDPGYRTDGWVCLDAQGPIWSITKPIYPSPTPEREGKGCQSSAVG